MLICCERKVLVAGGEFVLSEKYCWLVADKPNGQGVHSQPLCYHICNNYGFRGKIQNRSGGVDSISGNNSMKSCLHTPTY
jgi:hypothetical protein